MSILDPSEHSGFVDSEPPVIVMQLYNQTYDWNQNLSIFSSIFYDLPFNGHGSVNIKWKVAED